MDKKGNILIKREDIYEQEAVGQPPYMYKEEVIVEQCKIRSFGMSKEYQS